MSRFTLLFALLGSLLWSFPLAAEPLSGPELPDRSWGWALVIPSLLGGGVLTAYGLSIDCGPLDTACHRRASLAIWGGVGVLSLGSAFGLAILESGGRPSGVALNGKFWSL